jgi:hypothetical protein
MWGGPQHYAIEVSTRFSEMPLNDEPAKEKNNGTAQEWSPLEIVMVVLTAGVALVELVTGRYLIALMFAGILLLTLWRKH